MRKYIYLCLFILPLIHCGAPDTTNPLSSGYDGDYSFEIHTSWEDSAAVLSPCTLTVRSTGEDEFKSFRVETDDSLLLEKQSVTVKDSAAVLTFLKTVSDSLTVKGIRPNGKEVTARIPLRVVNPFSITGPLQAQPLRGEFSLERTFGMSNTDSGLVADWYVGDSPESQNVPFDSAFALPSLDAGTYTVKALISINDKPTVACSIQVEILPPGVPVLSQVELENDTIFTGDAAVVNVTAEDSDGTVEAVFAKSGEEGSGFVQIENGSFSHVYDETGTHTIEVYAVDDEGLTSDTATVEVTVLSSVPGIESFSITAPEKGMFAGDTLKVEVVAGDPAGDLDSIFVTATNGDNTKEKLVEVTGEKESVSLSFVFAAADTGVWNFTAQALNSRGELSQVQTGEQEVKAGAPVITDFTPDTVYALDTADFVVSAKDTNGVVSSFEVSIDGGDSWTESGDETFRHVFEVENDDREELVLVKVTDDAGLATEREFPVLVKRGAPEVWGDTPEGEQDTVFVVVDEGYSGAGVTYYARINSSDPNGSVVNHYWSNNAWPDSGTVTEGDSLEYEVDGSRINTGVTRYIHARDDDGLLSGGRFVVFADSAPGAITASSDNVENGRKFQWSGMDAKDSLDTEYLILVRKGEAPSLDNPEDVAKEWTPGREFDYDEEDVLPFSWTYTPDENGVIYYFQIISRDARGTMSSGEDAKGRF